MRPRRPLRKVLYATTALVPLGLAAAQANPLGPNVVGGSATVTGTGTATVTVTQSTQNAIINWHSFNIAAGEHTRFVQPNATSMTLNRVTGRLGPSTIDGTITANGRVFIVNPDGILIGRNATINTAGFLATTHDITNDDFMAGRLNFTISGRPDASVVNEGIITATNAGFAALVAPGVRNSGTITARFGRIGLASASAFSLDLYGDQLITLGVNSEVAATVRDVATGEPLSALIKNEGRLKANGGRVELTAAAARRVVDSVINTSGVIEARSIGRRNGKIVLGAATTRTADAPVQKVKVAGTLSVAGRRHKGGTITVTGEQIALAGATLDASGLTGGGTVLIGGDVGGGRVNPAVAAIPQARLEVGPVPTATAVTVDAATTINASATGIGDAGKVVVWADGATAFAGTVQARGGELGGRGGFVEVSGKETLSFSGSVDTTALRGQTGTLLLDPGNLTISQFGVDSTDDTVAGTFTGSNTADTTLLTSTLVNALNSSNVIVQTGTVAGFNDGDIIVASSFSWNTNNSLTLSAFRNIRIGATATITNTASGDLILRADNTGRGDGTLVLDQGTLAERIDYSGSTGRISLYYNPTVFPTPDVFPTTGNPRIALNPNVSDQFTAYMLVNTPAQLQQIASNLSGNYALGVDVLDMATVANFAPIGSASTPFTGKFDGLGKSISNLTIAPTGAGVDSVGLFAMLGADAQVHDLTLTNVSVTANPDVTAGQFVGTLAGQNTGVIRNVTVDGAINGGNVSAVLGGLVGQNGDLSQSIAATITGSSMNVDVTTAGANVAVGGLAGINAPGAVIQDSMAEGDVTATANLATCIISATCQFVFAGGLVGQNFGTIDSSNVLTTQPTVCGFGFSCALGDVTVGSRGIAGGLVGHNDGIIEHTFTFANVLGAAGPGLNGLDGDGDTALGGLVGVNTGRISNSFALGVVGEADKDRLVVGGFVAENSGLITDSFAFGNVSAQNFSIAGGFVGDNGPHAIHCAACTTGDGRNTDATIASSSVAGNVVTGSSSIAGGFAGVTSGPLNDVATVASVVVGDNSFAGGLVGVAVPHDPNSPNAGNANVAASPAATIGDSIALGQEVRSTGPNSVVGGFVGLNAIPISDSLTSAPVVGTSLSYLGGFAGLNLGRIASSQTLHALTPHTVTGTGQLNVIGGFVGANFGTIINSISVTNVAGSLSFLGSFAGVNSQFLDVASNLIPGSTFPVGTIVNSQATGTVNGTAGPFIGSTAPGTLPTLPSILSDCDDAVCEALRNGRVPQGEPPPVLDEVKTVVKVIEQLTEKGDGLDQKNVVNALIQLNPPVTQQTPGPGPTGPTGARVPPNQPFAPPQQLRTVAGLDGDRFSGLPPLNETRFFPDELVLQVSADFPQQQLDALAQRLGLTIISSETLTSLNRRAIRFRISGGRSVRQIIPQVEQTAGVNVQPNYQFQLVQAPAALPPGDTGPSRGDPAQYVVGKFHLHDVHRIARGQAVPIAVVDSEVDKDHSELAGAIAERFDAVGVEDKPHSHGTAMVGAIVARDRLLGIAPGARILAVRSFSESQATAEGTTFQILKGIEWAVNQGARVINMSFAGPYDPALAKALKAAHDKGVVLVAAAGNAGPKSPPLFPGADPNVIAVTATDPGDKVFRGANRGAYVSLAAPGVEILAPAPQESYQLSTGTSIATAHVSAVVALMLERDPTLKPDEVRRILQQTASDLGRKGRDNEYGWGLINPQRALAAVEARRKAATAPQR